MTNSTTSGKWFTYFLLSKNTCDSNYRPLTEREVWQLTYTTKDFLKMSRNMFLTITNQYTRKVKAGDTALHVCCRFR